MDEQKKTPLKEVFFAQLQCAFTDLVKATVNARNLGLVLVVWALLSVGASIFRYAADRCDKEVQLDTYLFAKLLCPVEKK